MTVCTIVRAIILNNENDPAIILNNENDPFIILNNENGLAIILNNGHYFNWHYEDVIDVIVTKNIRPCCRSSPAELFGGVVDDEDDGDDDSNDATMMMDAKVALCLTMLSSKWWYDVGLWLAMRLSDFQSFIPFSLMSSGLEPSDLFF